MDVLYPTPDPRVLSRAHEGFTHKIVRHNAHYTTGDDDDSNNNGTYTNTVGCVGSIGGKATII